jgi:hypothetical protein
MIAFPSVRPWRFAMRRVVWVLVAVAVSYCAPALACGDKYLLIGRGGTYRNRYVAIHPASILLYGKRAAGDGQVDVRRVLERAGHHVDFAADDAQLESAMKSKKYDFVIAPMDDVDTTESRVHALSSTVLVLPILFASNDDEVRRAERKYECIARSEAQMKQRSFLGVIDDAMEMRLKAQPMHCNWSK